MGVPATFRLHLVGGQADAHRLQGYDGYDALAGFAWTLCLVTNFIETRQIRHRGNFVGRELVSATVIQPGSVFVDFSVWLNNNPVNIFGASAAVFAADRASALLYSVYKRIIDRNIGNDFENPPKDLEELLDRYDGDVEALVAAAEPSIRRAHGLIGKSANSAEITAGFNIPIGIFDQNSKNYVQSSVKDEEIQTRDVSVASFNVNSGNGGVYDGNLLRVIPFSINKKDLARCRPIFSWGLDEYANRRGSKITIKFTRILALDSTVKKYIIQDASRSQIDTES